MNCMAPYEIVVVAAYLPGDEVVANRGERLNDMCRTAIRIYLSRNAATTELHCIILMLGIGSTNRRADGKFGANPCPYLDLAILRTPGMALT